MWTNVVCEYGNNALNTKWSHWNHNYYIGVDASHFKNDNLSCKNVLSHDSMVSKHRCESEGFEVHELILADDIVYSAVFEIPLSDF